MKINWKVRFRNPYFWIQIGIAILMPILAYLGLSVEDLTTWGKVGQVLLEAVLNPYVLGLVVVSVFNAIQDPTTKGLSDSEIIVKINGTEIDGYTYTNYELIVPEVTGDVLVIGKNKPVPVSFLTDDWSTIIDAVKNGNTDVYEVGATKTITLTSNDDDSGNTDGITSGTYTVD